MRGKWIVEPRDARGAFSHLWHAPIRQFVLWWLRHLRERLLCWYLTATAPTPTVALASNPTTTFDAVAVAAASTASSGGCHGYCNNSHPCGHLHSGWLPRAFCHGTAGVPCHSASEHRPSRTGAPRLPGQAIRRLVRIQLVGPVCGQEPCHARSHVCRRRGDVHSEARGFGRLRCVHGGFQGGRHNQGLAVPPHVPRVLHRHVAAWQGPRATNAFVAPIRAADLPAVQGGADRSPSTGLAPSATHLAHGTRAPDCTYRGGLGLSSPMFARSSIPKIFVRHSRVGPAMQSGTVTSPLYLGKLTRSSLVVMFVVRIHASSSEERVGVIGLVLFL
mmetsp:Transcript_77416/g.187051  ORF Transcript_77416/g.187051 Transcript_77416/m.187051 type:complete len:332 (-) Transcript_77416:19-1014(-)